MGYPPTSRPPPFPAKTRTKKIKKSRENANLVAMLENIQKVLLIKRITNKNISVTHVQMGVLTAYKKIVAFNVKKIKFGKTISVFVLSKINLLIKDQDYALR